MLQRYIIDPQTGEKRFNLELFLPLGGMIIVGIVGLVLGALYFQPNERPDDKPIDLPPIESYEQNRKKPAPTPAPPAPAAGQLDAGVDAGALPDAASAP